MLFFSLDITSIRQTGKIEVGQVGSNREDDDDAFTACTILV